MKCFCVLSLFFPKLGSCYYCIEVWCPLHFPQFFLRTNVFNKKLISTYLFNSLTTFTIYWFAFFSVKAQSNNILSFSPPHHPPLTPSRMKSSKQHIKVIIVTVLKRMFQIQFWNINGTKGDEGRVKEQWWYYKNVIDSQFLALTQII